jgi:chromosome segregation ATPase
VAKTRMNISVSSDVKERFKREFGSMSQEIEEMMRQRIEASSGFEGRIRELKSELDQASEELQELGEKYREKEREVERLENELQILQEEKQSIEDSQQADLDKFLEVAESSLQTDRGDDHTVKLNDTSWDGPSDVPEYWMQELQLSAEDLWTIAREHVFGDGIENLEITAEGVSA